MPRKKNRRKQIQAAKRAAEPKPKAERVAAIGHVSTGGAGLALAALASGLLSRDGQYDVLYEDLEKEQ